MGFSMVDLVNSYLLGKEGWTKSKVWYFTKSVKSRGNSIYKMGNAIVFQIHILVIR